MVKSIEGQIAFYRKRCNFIQFWSLCLANVLSTPTSHGSQRQYLCAGILHCLINQEVTEYFYSLEKNVLYQVVSGSSTSHSHFYALTHSQEDTKLDKQEVLIFPSCSWYQILTISNFQLNMIQLQPKFQSRKPKDKSLGFVLFCFNINFKNLLGGNLSTLNTKFRFKVEVPSKKEQKGLVNK